MGDGLHRHQATGRAFARAVKLANRPEGGAAGESLDRAMDVRISRHRTRLGEDPKNLRLIKTICGAGYIFLGDVVWS